MITILRITITDAMEYNSRDFPSCKLSRRIEILSRRIEVLSRRKDIIQAQGNLQTGNYMKEKISFTN